jgi:hypothetical protein
MRNKLDLPHFRDRNSLLLLVEGGADTESPEEVSRHLPLTGDSGSLRGTLGCSYRLR